MKRALELLQELSSMINSDKYPKMDGSHRLDHWKANKMVIEIVNRVKEQDQDLIHELATCLRDLHDIQNGPPLEQDREEYAAVMVRVIEVLDRVGY